MKNKPNPGTKKAREQGCRCPVDDNHKGRGVPMGGEYVFWINGDCPLHGIGTA